MNPDPPITKPEEEREPEEELHPREDASHGDEGVDDVPPATNVTTTLDGEPSNAPDSETERT